MGRIKRSVVSISLLVMTLLLILLTYQALSVPPSLTNAEYEVSTFFSESIATPRTVAFALLPYLNGTLPKEEIFDEYRLRVNSSKAEIIYTNAKPNKTVTVSFKVQITTNNITEVLGPSGSSLLGAVDFEGGLLSEANYTSASVYLYQKEGPFELLIYKEQYVRDHIGWRRNENIVSNRSSILWGFLLSATITSSSFTVLHILGSSSSQSRLRKALFILRARLPLLSFSFIFISAFVYLFIGATKEGTLPRKAFFGAVETLGPYLGWLLLNPVGTLLHFDSKHFLGNMVGENFPNALPLGLFAIGMILESYLRLNRKWYSLIFFCAGYSNIIMIPLGASIGVGASLALYWLIGETVIKLYEKSKVSSGRLQVIHYAIVLYAGFIFWNYVGGYLFPLSLERLFKHAVTDEAHPLNHLFALLIPFVVYFLRSRRKR